MTGFPKPPEHYQLFTHRNQWMNAHETGIDAQKKELRLDELQATIRGQTDQKDALLKAIRANIEKVKE